MERFEGYVVKSMKTARFARRIVARQNFKRLRLFIRLPLLILTAVYFAVAAMLSFSSPSLPPAFSILLFILLGLWVLYAIVFTILRPLANATPAKMTELATAYVRGLLTDTLVRFREELLAVPKHGKDLFGDARRYAADYILGVEEREVLLAKGALREEGEKIRLRYERYLREMIVAEEEGNRRYLEMRANMERTIEKWRRRHLPKYHKIQVLLIEQNITRLRQEVTDRREEFVRNNGVAAYLYLLEKVTVYEDPNDGGRALIIPRKEAYTSFHEIVKRLKGYDIRALGRPLQGDGLVDFKYLLDAYESHTAKYTVAGCETVDSIERLRKRYEDALADSKRCWRCKTPFNMRFREVCERCNHYICPRCNRCYCNKHIFHTAKKIRR